MAAQHKRSWKLQEFVAHGSNVSCLSLGPSSGRVMVTGGEDRKVNMWAVGKPNVILTLSGHTSPVEYVKFNSGEDLVIAGSQSGTLKIWDLEAAKIVRTLTGHKSSIRGIDFHPYGEFVASGSLDTNVKLWDVRRKGCIVTLKGHSDGINFVKFSPDGRWIVSASEDNTVKLWDLTSGKLLHEFKQHTAAVNCVEFHPKEFLLATASNDRTVKFWDLETFQLVSTTDAETNGIRCAAFHPDGHSLFSGAQDSMRVYGWEPVRCYDSVSLAWGKVADIAISSSQLIGASYHQTNVAVWVVDLEHLENLIAKYNDETADAVTGAPGEQKRAQVVPSTKTPPRKAFSTERPQTTSSKPRLKEEQSAIPEESANKEGEGINDDKNLAAPGDIFTAKKRLDRTPPRQKHEPFQPPLEDPLSQGPVKQAPVVKPSAIVPEPVKPTKPTSVNDKPANKQKDMIPSERDKPAGLQLSDFLPARTPMVNEKDANNEQNIRPKNPAMSEKEAVSTLAKSHESIAAIMTSRLKNLSVVARFWGDGDIKNAVQISVDMNDQAVLVDLLNVLCLKQTLWNLDVCSLVLPHLKDLISSKYESYVQAGAMAIKLILRNFAPVIKSNMAAPPVSVGVDLVREERYNKCHKCYLHLRSIREALSSKTSISGKMGSLFREMSLAFSSLD
ncbi:Katanin p80 WD40 repeat-containing subunit B1 [Desmophyllum pertusum]|uniref:Katanin p80 WD40 repeat-containing subunit B1 n=1 Tax=Desmophyllum pertusum TaxID=174260 RepID=A0A9W9ZKS7_9CNID|nr:Katanin p80 WD40 repeat-containing subunit B1 [Desmophyllum pertusum]